MRGEMLDYGRVPPGSRCLNRLLAILDFVRSRRWSTIDTAAAPLQSDDSPCRGNKLLAIRAGPSATVAKVRMVGRQPPVKPSPGRYAAAAAALAPCWIASDPAPGSSRCW